MMIPVANCNDDFGYSAITPKEGWRKYFSNRLRGGGLDIGALHRPMEKHDGMEVTYIDQFPLEVLKEHYPELVKKGIVKPDILEDAQTLETIPDKSFDFVIAAHVIEHMRNPILAIENWLRVLKTGGKLYLVVPDKRAIFDNKRVRTTLAHIVNDYLYPSSERDEEHYLQYAEFVDNYIHFEGKLSPKEIVDQAQYLIRQNYSIHYHCFLPVDMVNLLIWMQVNSYVEIFTILEGPIMTKGDSEFHILLEKI